MDTYSIKSYEGEIGYNYKSNFDDAIEAIDTSIKSFYDVFTDIMKENDFAPEQEERWTKLADKFYQQSIELREQIDNKYKEMWARAQQLEKWYYEARELDGFVFEETDWPFPVSDDDKKQYHEECKVDNVGLNGEEYPAITFSRTTKCRERNEDGSWKGWYNSKPIEYRTYDIYTEIDYTNYVKNYNSVFRRPYTSTYKDKINPVSK